MERELVWAVCCLTAEFSTSAANLISQLNLIWGVSSSTLSTTYIICFSLLYSYLEWSINIKIESFNNFWFDLVLNGEKVCVSRLLSNCCIQYFGRLLFLKAKSYWKSCFPRPLYIPACCLFSKVWHTHTHTNTHFGFLM